MFELSRTVRLPISTVEPAAPARNGLVGSPSGGVGAVAEVEVVCVGAPDASGYLVDISLIDRAVRAVLQPAFSRAVRDEVRTGSATDVGALLEAHADPVAALLPAELRRLSFRPSAFHAVELAWPRPIFAPRPDSKDAPASGEAATRNSQDPSMQTTPQTEAAPARHRPSVVLHETFEFAASHRLALRGRSDAENRAMFGKCSNPNGHGHNYRMEVSVEKPMGSSIAFPDIERIVDATIMQRFDHRYLNLDCPEFAELNPSVEHIAQVCFGLLEPALAADGGRLQCVRVWETDKTSCRYPA